MAVLSNRLDPTRLARCVDELAQAIANGTCVPTALELKALAQVCDDHRLPAEAARVRALAARSIAPIEEQAVTHEQHQLRHRELHQAFSELLTDWLAHHAVRRNAALTEALVGGEPTPLLQHEIERLREELVARPIRDVVTWSSAQTINPVPLPGELHDERSSAAHEPCDEACGRVFRDGVDRRCRHLRTAEDWLRSR